MTYRFYATESARITENIAVSPTGCWEWQQYVAETGYARLRVNKKVLYGHRFAYELFVGPIPNGLHLDHLCRNRACVNPEHLEPVTPAMNAHRGPSTIAARNAAKRECPQGHSYDEANTSLDKRGCRSCRTCNRAAVAAWRARQGKAA